MNTEHEALLRQLRDMQAKVDALDRQLHYRRTRKRAWPIGLGIAALALLFSWAAHSQSDSTEFLLMKQVAELETRMGTVEKQLAAGKFKAPFSIVDEKGAPVVSVLAGARRGLYVSNEVSGPAVQAKSVAIEAGERVGVRVHAEDGQQVWMGDTAGGASIYLAGSTDENDIKTLMDAKNGFEVRRINKRVAALGMTEKDNVALRLYSENQQKGVPLIALGVQKDHGGLEVSDMDANVLARLGTIDDKTGFMEIYASGDEKPSASMSVNDQGGVLGVHDEDNGLAIASLSQGVNGGLFQLTDFDGSVMVKGGVTDKRTGALIAGPKSSIMGSEIMGAPADP